MKSYCIDITHIPVTQNTFYRTLIPKAPLREKGFHGEIMETYSTICTFLEILYMYNSDFYVIGLDQISLIGKITRLQLSV